MDERDSKEKSKLTLSLNKDVIQRAKAAGINISEITEKMLTAVTLTPAGNTIKDVVEAYMTFFESIKKTLSKYGGEVTLERRNNIAIRLNDEGLFRDTYDKDGHTFGREPIYDEEIVLYYLGSPIKLLDKVIKVLIESAERNRENIAELQFALKLVKALSEEKGDDKD